MIFAVISLAIVLGGAVGAFVWLVKELRTETRLSIAVSKDFVKLREDRLNVAKERDEVRAESIRLKASLDSATREISSLLDSLSKAREEVASARRTLPTDPALVPAAVDAQLRERRKATTARVAPANKRNPPEDRLSRPGPATGSSGEPGDDVKP